MGDAKLWFGFTHEFQMRTVPKIELFDVLGWLWRFRIMEHSFNWNNIEQWQGTSGAKIDLLNLLWFYRNPWTLLTARCLPSTVSLLFPWTHFKMSPAPRKTVCMISSSFMKTGSLATLMMSPSVLCHCPECPHHLQCYHPLLLTDLSVHSVPAFHRNGKNNNFREYLF